MPATFQPSPDRQCSVCAGEVINSKSINSMPPNVCECVPVCQRCDGKAWWNTPQKQVSAMVGVAQMLPDRIRLFNGPPALTAPKLPKFDHYLNSAQALVLCTNG